VLFGFIDRTSSATSLRASLDVSAERTRAIASRVSRASLGGDGFALPIDPQAPAAAGAPAATEPAVDVEAEMANLADEQLHFEATAKLLQKTYERLRSVIRER